MECPEEIAGAALFEKWVNQSRYFLDRAMSTPEMPAGTYCWNYLCTTDGDRVCPIADVCSMEPGILDDEERDRRISIHTDLYDRLDGTGFALEYILSLRVKVGDYLGELNNNG